MRNGSYRPPTVMYQVVTKTHQIWFSMSDTVSFGESRVPPSRVAGGALPRSRRPPCIDDCCSALYSVLPFLLVCPTTMEAVATIDPRSTPRRRRRITTAVARTIRRHVITHRLRAITPQHRVTTRRRVITNRPRATTPRAQGAVTGLIRTRVGAITAAEAGTVGVAIMEVAAAVTADKP